MWADQLLVSLDAAEDLSMSEADWVMAQIQRQAPNAQVIVGAAVSPERQGRLAVTVIASRRPPAGQNSESDPAEGSEANAPAVFTESELDSQFFAASPVPRPRSRFVAPPPELTPERLEELLSRQQASPNGPARRIAQKLKQGSLPAQIIAKGRFEKSEPTIHRGEDLDVPTYIRRGIPLN
jgi:cell division protein FtsZ